MEHKCPSYGQLDERNEAEEIRKVRSGFKNTFLKALIGDICMRTVFWGALVIALALVSGPVIAIACVSDCVLISGEVRSEGIGVPDVDIYYRIGAQDGFFATKSQGPNGAFQISVEQSLAGVPLDISPSHSLYTFSEPIISIVTPSKNLTLPLVEAKKSAVAQVTHRILSLIKPFGGNLQNFAGVSVSMDGTAVGVTNANGLLVVNSYYNSTPSFSLTHPDFAFVKDSVGSLVHSYKAMHAVSGTTMFEGKPASSVFLKFGQLKMQSKLDGKFTFMVSHMTPPTSIEVTDMRFKGSQALPLITSNVSGVVVNMERRTFPVSGKITMLGAPLSGIAIDGGELGVVFSDIDGNFNFPSAAHGTKAVLTPKQSGLAFTPPSSTFTVTGPEKNMNFDASLADSYVFSATFKFDGRPLAGVSLEVAPFGSAVSDGAGQTVIAEVPYGVPYNALPRKGAFTFNPPVVSGEVLGDTHIEFAATCEPPNILSGGDCLPANGCIFESLFAMREQLTEHLAKIQEESLAALFALSQRKPFPKKLFATLEAQAEGLSSTAANAAGFIPAYRLICAAGQGCPGVNSVSSHQALTKILNEFTAYWSKINRTAKKLKRKKAIASMRRNVKGAIKKTEALLQVLAPGQCVSD